MRILSIPRDDMALAISMTTTTTNPSLVPHSTTLHHHRSTFHRRAERPVQSNVVAQLPLVANSHSVRPREAVKKSDSRTQLAEIWREIQGCDDWEGMVEPLHPLLRSEIIRYGELVSACYKAFDLDPRSKRFMNCKYGKKRMLESVGMEDSGYEVVKYVYATPDIDVSSSTGRNTCCSRWIGYVAVSSDNVRSKLGRRDILVAFRGTVTSAEWIANFMSFLTPARLDPSDPWPDIKVESGFLCLYTSRDSTCKFSQGSCREQLLSEVSRLISKYKDEEVSITLAGHSMGSSLALLLGYDLAELGLNRVTRREVPITVHSFGGPKVGNSGFKQRCEKLGVKVLRVANVNDPVTKLPGVFMNENFRVFAGKYEMPWSCSCYAHVGVELALDFFKIENPTCVHDLEAYIGLLKCFKVARVRKRGADFLTRAKGLMGTKALNGWPWQDAVRQVGSLVQSLGF